MVGIHKAQRESSVIVTTTQLKGDLEHNAKRRQIRQVEKHDIKFPLLHKRIDCTSSSSIVLKIKKRDES